MSPRDALKRMTFPFTPAPRPEADDVDVAGTSSRLAAILTDVAGTSVVDTPAALALPMRDASVALRWFMLSDVLALGLGFAASWLLAAAANILFLDRAFPMFLAAADWGRILHYGVMTLGVMLWFAHKGHYRTRQPFWTQAQQVVIGLSYAMMLDGFLQFATKQDFSRLWLVSGWVFAIAFVLGLRGVMRRVLSRLGVWQVRTLLVGSGTTADAARAALRSERGLGYEIVSQVENLPLLLASAGHSWQRLCERFRADYVVIALDGDELLSAEDALAQLSREGVAYSVSPPLRRLPVLGMEPLYFFNHDVMLLAPTNNLDRFSARFLKRSLDVLVSGAGLLVGSPLLLGLCLLVKLDGGPAFFGHRRIGRGGRTFSCLKLRSMVTDSEARLKKHLAENPAAREEWNREQKLRDDPRVTKVGAFMRRTSLDELPQLINVLRGDMSLVGPRPIVQAEVTRYDNDILNYYRVRPGITGLWQVSGRSDVSYEGRVQMDAWYVRNWSLWHDVAILCKTVPALLNKTGAY